MLYILDHIEEISSEATARMLDALPESRRSRCLSYKHESNRRLCALAYLLLRYALRESRQITHFTLDYKESGQPYLVEHPNLFISISHCREAVAVAVAETPVGVDVESNKRYTPRLANYVLSEKELHTLQQADNIAQAFTRLWTQKEAYVKQTGTGLTVALKPLLESVPPTLLNSFHPTDEYTLSLCQANAADQTITLRQPATEFLDNSNSL